jgi:hypothetical protein
LRRAKNGKPLPLDHEIWRLVPLMIAPDSGPATVEGLYTRDEHIELSVYWNDILAFLDDYDGTPRLRHPVPEPDFGLSGSLNRWLRRRRRERRRAEDYRAQLADPASPADR